MFIYMLQNEGLILYVGRTTDFKRRYREHCYRRDSCGSREIPTDMPWTMALLEECEDVLGASREQYFFDTLKPLYNVRRPGQTQKEYQHKYYAAHPEQRRETLRKYEAANRETRNARKRERRRIAHASSQADAALTTHLPVEAAS